MVILVGQSCGVLAVQACPCKPPHTQNHVDFVSAGEDMSDTSEEGYSVHDSETDNDEESDLLVQRRTVAAFCPEGSDSSDCSDDSEARMIEGGVAPNSACILNAARELELQEIPETSALAGVYM